MTELYIRNMVCDRCKLVVENELVKMDLHPVKVNFGYVQLQESGLSEEKKAALAQRLESFGFELLDDTKLRIIEKIKNCIIAKIHHSKVLDLKVNWSKLIAAELNQDYSSLSALFSSFEGITIQQYIIRQKIEKAKEFLFYDELSLSEISYRLGYSSVQHLSSQFKRITGETPSEFKASRPETIMRKAIDSVI